jgi:hypothetical protein
LTLRARLKPAITNPVVPQGLPIKTLEPLSKRETSSEQGIWQSLQNAKRDEPAALAVYRKSVWM